MDFNYKDLLDPIVRRFNTAVETFLKDIQKKLDDPDIQFKLLDTDIDSNGFIQKITLFKVKDNDRKLTLEVMPKIDGHVEFAITDTAIEKSVKWKTNQEKFWRDVDRGYAFVENFFRMDLMFQAYARTALS